PNIRWHGVLPYYQAMAHAAASDVGLVPFGEGAITASVDPIKYYDYTAARCRTVATSAMTELRGRKYCHLGEPGELIDAVLAAAEAPAITEAQAQAFCRANSWNARADAILRAAEEL
ncbi:MAG: hypothetical protein U9R79_09370, partial [Armatimonadota bacterium]|nr:hypothetical protein [Armatimonadota bacterium]